PCARPITHVLDSARYRDVHEYANAYGSHLHPSPPHSRSASPVTTPRPIGPAAVARLHPGPANCNHALALGIGISNGDQISNEPSWNPNDVCARASGSTYTAFAYSAAPATTSTVSGPTVSNPNGAGSSSSSQGVNFSAATRPHPPPPRPVDSSTGQQQLMHMVKHGLLHEVYPHRRTHEASA
ncbi:hypothetical protein BCR44DRAFT_1463310, partial [Catenaria anguillulae PL171]